MSNAEYVREVLLTCPLIKAGPFDMMVDFLKAKTLTYSIEGEPSAQVIKKYRGGDTMRRYAFVLIARRDVIEDADRVENAANYEQLSLWLEEQTRLRRLPPMDGGARALRLEATGAPYLDERSDDGDTAVYLMQLELTYYQTSGV